MAEKIKSKTADLAFSVMSAMSAGAQSCSTEEEVNEVKSMIRADNAVLTLRNSLDNGHVKRMRAVTNICHRLIDLLNESENS
jgi:hypothetical protein